MRGIDVISLRLNGRRHPNCYAISVPNHTLVIVCGKMLYVKRVEDAKIRRYIDHMYTTWDASTYKMLMEVDSTCANKERIDNAIAKGELRVVEMNG